MDKRKHPFARQKVPGGSIRFKLLILILFLVLLISAFFIFGNKASAPKDGNKTQAPVSRPTSIGFKKFTGQQFEDLYNSFAYPNTELINENTPITGNDKADARIRQLAIAKGYKLRSAPVTDTFKTVQKGMKLQIRAADGWIALKNRAEKTGLKFSLAAAYRSAEDQKTIFLSKLSNIPVGMIAEGKADDSINEVLKRTALPGYSRHHTGYTVDIACLSDPGVKFENSKCFKWLNADNYLNAKKSGWIPSYPSGAGKQGPDPEPWEYVWVGIDALK